MEIINWWAQCKSYEVYEPGKEIFVADAISRQLWRFAVRYYYCHASEKPLNCFKNLFVLKEPKFLLKRDIILFCRKILHLIKTPDKNTLFEVIKLLVSINSVKAIYYDLPTLANIQHDLLLNFPTTARISLSSLQTKMNKLKLQYHYWTQTRA